MNKSRRVVAKPAAECVSPTHVAADVPVGIVKDVVFAGEEPTEAVSGVDCDTCEHGNCLLCAAYDMYD